MYDVEVAVTGMGLVTPLGMSVEENWKNLLAKKTGIARSAGSSPSHPICCQYKGEVRDDLPQIDLPAKLLSQKRFLNRGSTLGFFAAHEAVSRAHPDLTVVQPGRRALYVATGELSNVGCPFMHPAIMDGIEGTCERMNFEKLNQATLDKVNPFFLLESISNNPFSFLSAYLEFMGPNTSLASLSPCGIQAMELACRSIRYGEADIAVAVGCSNWITEVPLYEMASLGLLSKCKNGALSFRPFDRHRDGFIAAEGGAAVVLESCEKAEARGAKILARLRGFGSCVERSNGTGIEVPSSVHGSSIRKALGEAGCGLGDLAFICPHGSGTQKGDKSELRSLAEVASKEGSTAPICGLKPYTGHMAAASDIAEVIFGINAASRGMVPATLNFDKSEEEFVGLSIANEHRECGKKCFLSVGYGLIGQSCSVVVEVA
jgi:3-oxoacyl-[acyl-carrier-protein] synthase II